jgi:hypothetical protein
MAYGNGDKRNETWHRNNQNRKSGMAKIMKSISMKMAENGENGSQRN